jgi:hypothetical protein
MFFKKGRGRCGCVYGTEGAVDRKSLGTAEECRLTHLHKIDVENCFRSSACQPALLRTSVESDLCLKSALFCDITRRRVVFTDVSGQRISPIFTGQESE